MKNKLYFIVLLLFPLYTFAQIMPLTNPSFEDIAKYSHVPRGWYDCGFPGESPPDTQPDPSGTFEVYQMPYDGNTYLGLVTRDNDTWEAVSQKLPEKLNSVKCYTLYIMAARSEKYISLSRLTEAQVNYNTPVVIRIYGGMDYCNKSELLAETKNILDTHWQEYQLTFTPSRNYTHIIIEAYYAKIAAFPYNGNVLIDDIQLEIGCGNTTSEVNKVNETLVEQSTVLSSDTLINERRKPVDLQADLPTTVEDLQNSIAKYGQYVYFSKNGSELETDDFTFNNQEYKNVNKYLAFIAKAMQQFPDYRLIISVDGKDDVRYVRTINLQDHLLKLGLDEDHFTVYPYNALDLRKQWLWIATDNDLLMQIVQTKK